MYIFIFTLDKEIMASVTRRMSSPGLRAESKGARPKEAKGDINYELAFWLPILGDHGRFIAETTAAKHEGIVQIAEKYTTGAEEFLARLKAGEPISRIAGGQRQAAPGSAALVGELESFTSFVTRPAEIVEESKGLIGDIKKYAVAFRGFKIWLRGEVVSGKIVSNLSPIFFTEMIDEIDEFISIFTHYETTGDVPIAVDVTRYHNLWLTNATIHADAIFCGLDGTACIKRKKIMKFKKKFGMLGKAANEFIHLISSSGTNFPALTKFTKMAGVKTRLFMACVQELRDKRALGEILGSVQPLFLDHTLRELCYYLNKLAIFNPEVLTMSIAEWKAKKFEKADTIGCDPTKSMLSSASA